MKIIAFDVARLTVLFPFEEVAPLTGANGHVIISNIKERYRFANSPDLSVPREELNKIGLRFETGIMQNGEDSTNIIEFVIFSDGVVITSNTTEGAEKFWHDVMRYMIDENGFREFSTEPIERFISQIVVEFERPLDRMIRSYESISKEISERLSHIYQSTISLGLSKIELEFDKVGQKSSLQVPKFIIERRIGIAFGRERYYCSAPMRTQDHIDLLRHIETSLG